MMTLFFYSYIRFNRQQKGRSEMQIIKKEKGEFGKIKIDFYLNKDREILVTIEQLAQGFGYKKRKGIERMLERNSYCKGTPQLGGDPRNTFI